MKTKLLVLFATLSLASGLSANVDDSFRSVDTDHNNILTLEEFLASWDKLNVLRDKDKDGKMTLQEYGESLFNQVDTNKDGYVTLQEDRDLRAQHFNVIDKNQNGSISYQEYCEVHKAPAASVETATGQKQMSAQISINKQLDTSHRPVYVKVEALADLTKAPAMWLADGYEASESLAAIYYDAVDWKGQATKVFAWLGLPDLDKGQNAPAVVLVHGGGGTAYKDWVQLWTERGYVAISIAVEGQTDARDSAGSQHSPWERHQWAGPHRVGIYGDSHEPIEDQWMYHAVADVVLANSLLRSLPEVDADRVGIMGISWGGVITSTVIGLDPRFAFAIPVYGCGSLATAQNIYGKSLADNELYQQVWDPTIRMSHVETPTLWLSWPEDSHFPLDSQASTYSQQLADRMVALIPEMGHGHSNAWNRPESYAFADSITSGQAWCLQTSRKYENEVAYIDFSSAKPLEEPMLYWTPDSGVTGERKWIAQLATMVNNGSTWTAFARVPQQATACFINVRSGDLVASSDYIEFR